MRSLAADRLRDRDHDVSLGFVVFLDASAVRRRISLSMSSASGYVGRLITFFPGQWADWSHFYWYAFRVFILFHSLGSFSAGPEMLFTHDDGRCTVGMLAIWRL